MNKLDQLIPKIKRNLKKFDKPEILFVRPGYCIENRWPTKELAIVVVTSASAGKVKIPRKIDGVRVEARRATKLEQFSHDHPNQFSQAADHRAELRGSALPEFNPVASVVRPKISARVSLARQKKPEIAYTPANVTLEPVTGSIPMTCHVSPDAGWPMLEDFVSGTKQQLKVSMYDFTSNHVLQLFQTKLKGKKLQITLDDPPAPNRTANQSDPVTIQNLKNALAARFSSAWALVRSSREADTWIYPTAYHIKVMVRDSDTVWLSSGNLNNSNQPEINPIGDPQPGDQQTAKKSDRDWHVIIESKKLAKMFEAYLDHDFQQATIHAASSTPAIVKVGTAQAPNLSIKRPMKGTFQFAAAKQIKEPVTITPLLTPDPGVYQAAMLGLIANVRKSLYIQLQYIHPSNLPENSKFTELIDAVAQKIDAGKDVRIILSEFQAEKGGLEALQAAGVNLDNVRIQNNVHNKGFIFDHKRVVVSSMNWSGEGVLSNRDAGVLIENATAAAYYEEIFLDDWDNHSERKMPTLA